jgi:hypothetical protein
MILIFLATGILCVVLVALWDRHHEASMERRRTGWLASFYEAPSSKDPRR